MGVYYGVTWFDETLRAKEGLSYNEYSYCHS